MSQAAGYRLWRICQRDTVEIRPWYATFPVLGGGAVASILAYLVWPRALLLLLGIAIVNIVLRVMLHGRTHHLLAPFRQIGPLLSCAEYVLDPSVSGDFGDEARAHLHQLRSLKSTANWASREYSMQNELAASTWEYLNVLFLLDANAMLLATRALRRNGDSLLKVIEFLGEVDAAISTASFRAGSKEWCVPRFVEPGGPTILREAVHPIVPDAVPNSIVLHPGRGVIVTGSNMSGKSTLLRTVGLTALLAQALNTCPATAYSSSRLRIRSAIGRSDDLAAGKSYYLVEVETVLDLVRDRCSPVQHLFLFDELFRGTNTIERLAAGEAVLTALLSDDDGRGRHIVIAATHDIELVEMLAESYEPYHFEDSIGAEGLSFDYVVRTGPASTRNAIALLKVCGAPSELVTRARKTVESLESP